MPKTKVVTEEIIVDTTSTKSTKSTTSISTETARSILLDAISKQVVISHPLFRSIEVDLIALVNKLF